MGEIALAVAASHAPGLTGLFDSAPEDSKAVVNETYGALGKEIREADLDAIIIVANDHLANSRIRAYPDFLIGLADEHTGPFEWFKPWLGCEDYRMVGDRKTGEALFNGFCRRGVRVFATHENLRYDDNVSVPALLTDIEGSGVPMVPVLQNCTVPPMPDQHRSYEVGQALADLIVNDLPDGFRVGLFASGGLSHEPGGERDFFIDQEFDHWFLDLLAAGDHERLLAEMTPERMNAAGEGGTTELFTWVLVLGAVGAAPCEVLGYTAYEKWRCGIGVVRWDVQSAVAAA